jgi:putative addiction module CopG family antidote
MPIQLTPEQEQIVRQQLAVGGYRDAAEVLDTALRDFAARKEESDPIADIRRKIQRGIDQADRGEFVNMSVMEIAAEARRRREARQ